MQPLEAQHAGLQAIFEASLLEPRISSPTLGLQILFDDSKFASQWRRVASAPLPVELPFPPPWGPC